jgi:hypothetical protein
VSAVGYWPSYWPGEDGGPSRTQTVVGVDGPCLADGAVQVTHREAIAVTMIVLRSPGEVFALRHTAGPTAVSWVERIDPVTLESLARSEDLAGGPTWPGGLAVHANGSLYVVFGSYAHRLDAALHVMVSRQLDRNRPYNGFVILPDGHLVTKDFGGPLPGARPDAPIEETCEVVVLEPEKLRIVARCAIPEASIARLSADGDDVYVVGTQSLRRMRWNGIALRLDDEFAPRYRTVDGQTYGWDAVIALGAAWFLDNGFGAERYVGTFRDQGVNTAPLHLVRVDLATGGVGLTEICGLANGVIANPPLVDPLRMIVVGYDSGNGVLAAFDIAADGSLTQRWRRDQNHACHQLLYADTGELLTTDHDSKRMMDQFVIVDIETGDERVRIDSGSPFQSVLFPAPGFGRDLYLCSFPTISRLAAK